jgi:hypothetical protein
MVVISPPDGVISLVSYLATKKHKTMHHAQTDETMVHIRFHEIFDVALTSVVVLDPSLRQGHGRQTCEAQIHYGAPKLV